MTISATAAAWPIGPSSAMIWPGSGLCAGVLYLVAPSGYSIRFCLTALTALADARAAGAPTAARITVSPMAEAANRAAARGVYRTHAITPSTGITAHAVVFIAQASARTSPAHTSRSR
jgi:hypothetical protein